MTESPKSLLIEELIIRQKITGLAREIWPSHEVFWMNSYLHVMHPKTDFLLSAVAFMGTDEAVLELLQGIKK